MDFTDKDIAEFQALYSAGFKESLSPDEARHMLSQLVLLYEHLARPIPTDKPCHLALVADSAVGSK